MSIKIEGFDINNVCIVDDDDLARESLEFTVEDAKMTALPQDESVEDIEAFLTFCKLHADAVVSDHHLMKKRNYFPVNGAEFVSKCYDRNIPSVLVTRYELPEIHDIRMYRHKIPIVLAPEEFGPESFLKSLETIINEFKGVYVSERKPWRTLVRVDDVDIEGKGNFYVFVPAWNPNKAISLNKKGLPEQLQKLITPDFRFHAKVNLGANSLNDLFFKDWEYQ